MFKNCLICVFMWIVCCLFVAIPGAYAQDGYALEIGTGMTVTIDDNSDALRLGSYTYELWLKDLEGNTGGWRRVFHKGLNNVNTGRGPLLSLRPDDPGMHFSHSTGSGQQTANSIGGLPVNEWTHIALVLTALDGEEFIYQNGVEVATTGGLNLTADTQEAVLSMGAAANVILDDFRIWNYPKTDVEIQEGMGRELLGTEEGLVGYWQFNEGEGDTVFDSSPSGNHGTLAGAVWSVDVAPVTSARPPGGAYGPAPSKDADDVPRDVVLSWKPGTYADTHDVYLGTAFGDVNDADAAHPLDVLVSAGQTDARFDAGVLQFNQTYYWRVDEVNAAPDNTIFTGDIWSFTVEPQAIGIQPVAATASGANPGMEPEKTIDGSGLNELDQHSAIGSDMWLTPMAGSWIQYEFDRAYKLHELLVWNSNQTVETFIGFGVQEAIIETSLDGDVWTAVEGVPPFGRGTASAGYQANTVVDLGGSVAKFVKIIPQSAYGLTGQVGLSEVQFLAIPTDPRALEPANGSVTADTEVTLSWRAGREAVTHEVYLGPASDNLALMGTTDGPVFVTDPLDYDQTHYWQVVEVNDAETPARYASDILSFTTPAYGVVDDFESYTGEEGQEVFMAWFDGFGGDATLGGSTTGHIDAPFVETGMVFDGQQSMPVYIDNDGGFFDIDGKAGSSTFSEVVRELDSQDWTTGGIKTLSIMFAGSAGLTGQLYCKIGSNKITYDGDATNLGLSSWQAWNIDLSAVGGNLTDVRELALGVEGGTSGVLFIDAIRLYPRVSTVVVPVMPDTTNLVAYYPLDGDYQDASGNMRHGEVPADSAAVFFLDGVTGQAIDLSRGDAYVRITGYQGIIADRTDPDNPAQNPFTVACWINTTGNGSLICWGGSDGAPVGGQYQNFRVDGGRLRSEHGDGRFRGAATVNDGEWHHVALAVNTGNMIPPVTRIYVDGVQDSEGADTANAQNIWNITAEADVTIGSRASHGDRFFEGAIDEARLYDRALSAEEIAGLAGKTKPIHQPF